METGLFEFQADQLSGFRQTRQASRRPLERSSTRCSGGLISASFDRDPASHGITNGTEAGPAPCRNLLNLLSIPPLSSRVAFCVSPICPTTRSIASADMKQRFGAKPARSYLRLMPWIAANHRIEGAVSVWAAG